MYIMQRQTEQERKFLEGGPFNHICTKPLETDIYFRSEEEYREGLNIIAIAVTVSGIRLLAYSVMSNHFHFVVEGTEERVEIFWDVFIDRLGKFLSRTGRGYLTASCAPKIVPINNLRQLKVEIVYVIRNQFAVQANSNIFSCIWNSGHLYFNSMLPLMKEGVPAAKMTIQARRNFKHERNPDLDPRLMVLDGLALPSSFVDYRRAESFFENAREFQHWTLKNVESQVEVAKRIGEKVNLDDTELKEIVRGICWDRYRQNSVRNLSGEAVAELARTLKFDYSASNAQIARCVGIRLTEVDQMFPLSAKEK